MKTNVTTRCIAMLLCLITIFFVSCTAQNAETKLPSGSEPTTSESVSEQAKTPENGAKKIVSQKRNVYSSADEVEEMTFAHYEDTPEILLIDAETASTLIASQLSDFGKFETKQTDTTLTISRDNGAYCLLDFVEDSIYFNNVDLFRARYYDNLSYLLMSKYVDSEGNEIYFKKTDSTEIAGNSVSIDLASRDIPLDIYEGKKYLPFQTVNDLFIAPFEINYLFNSKDLFRVGDTGVLDPSLEDEYFSIEPTDRSEALAEFSLKELCMVMDVYYGLKDEHGITDGFESYFEKVGLLDDLRSSNPTTANVALASLLVGYLADKHSELLLQSPYHGSASLDYNTIKYETSVLKFFDFYDMITAARAKVMPDGVPSYQEIGNTAYVTFDSFTLSSDRFLCYTENATTLDDTLSLIMYAHAMITRENSPIENVVLDISCNGGGYVDTTIYVIAWMLGYCDFHISNPNTGASSTTSYLVDVNLDGVFDKKDTISDKNLFCLVSPFSFSGANCTAALLKESGMVTLLGGTSTGGTCAVQMMSTADGSLFRFSSSLSISSTANGSYYNIDRGVEPHIHLSKLESYFERESLTEYLNSLK